LGGFKSKRRADFRRHQGQRGWRCIHPFSKTAVSSVSYPIISPLILPWFPLAWSIEPLWVSEHDVLAEGPRTPLGVRIVKETLGIFRFTGILAYGIYEQGWPSLVKRAAKRKRDGRLIGIHQETPVRQTVYFL
jgi:hypothetical protein